MIYFEITVRAVTALMGAATLRSVILTTRQTLPMLSGGKNIQVLPARERSARLSLVAEAACRHSEKS